MGLEPERVCDGREDLADSGTNAGGEGYETEDDGLRLMLGTLSSRCLPFAGGQKLAYESEATSSEEANACEDAQEKAERMDDARALFGDAGSI